MSQTISVTEARDNFPALVRQVAERDEQVVVTSRNQPRVVLMRWETYQQQQALQVEGAERRLQTVVDELTRLVASMQEGYQPDSHEYLQSAQELQELARQAWQTCRSLDTPRLDLSSTIADSLRQLSEAELLISDAQLTELAQSLPLLYQKDLSPQDVINADQALDAVGLDAMPSMDDELVGLYAKSSS